MYLTERPARARTRAPSGGRAVAGTVVLLGIVSMFTDISSESVNAVLPLYLTAVVGLGPLAYGFIDGIYQGVSALVRILGGWVADRGDHPKWVAFFGYALSAISRIALIPAAGLATITTVITVDRLGKGVRTAPRDALIAAASEPDSLGRAFGVHRALDTLGAVIGPLLAFAILQTVAGHSPVIADFHAIFVISFAAAVIGLAVLLLVVPDLRPRRLARPAKTEQVQPANEQPPAGERPGRPTLALLADRRFALLVVATTVLGVLTVGDGFVYLALQKRDDLAINYFPLLYVGTNLAYFAMAVPFGQLADRLGRARMFLAGHLALPLTYLLAGGPLSGPVVVLGCLLLLGSYYAATDGVLAALAGRIVPAPARASGIATAQTVQAAARFVSSLAFGLSWTLYGPRTALYLVAGVLVVALSAGWLLWWRTDAKTGRYSKPAADDGIVTG
ncbi:MAG TPA: MFS transporter [Jatrophihabitans sp.]|nr:MFS transporter [Jatrophihabitans sp.]